MSKALSGMSRDSFLYRLSRGVLSDTLEDT